MLRSRLKLEEGWTSFLLLMFMLLCVVWSVRAAEWTDGLGILQWIVIAAMFLGLFLAQMRRLPGLVAHLLALVIGAVWVIAMLSIIFNPPLVPSGLVAPGSGLLARLKIMYQQGLSWFQNPDIVEPWLSNFMFVSALAALTWLLCYSNTWFVFRRHWVWGAVVSAGAACLLNIYYAPPRLMLYFALYCLGALLLIVRMHVYIRQKAWRQAAVNYSLDVDLTFIRDGALISLLAVILAWTIPAAVSSRIMADFWANFQEPWHEVQTQWSRLFTSLNYQGPSRRVNFGRTLMLGGAVNLSNTPLLEVQAAEPHYWRAVTYDLYTGSGWSDTDNLVLTLRPDERKLRPVSYMMQREFTQTIRMLESGEDFLFCAGQPLHTSVFARAFVADVPFFEGWTEVSMLQALRSLRRNESYTIVSLVSTASANQLRAAGTDYPAWVKRYLQLPSNLPDRVRELSHEIAGNARTPYDAAMAIQNYLRQLTYDQYISAPPTGRDVVDWFLFEKRRGYCDYYASAMAVMCRVLGIPACVAQGYAPGEYIAASRSYRVYQLNAHAWPEVYFPSYGWIEFEPTASQPVIPRPEGPALPFLPGELNDLSSQRQEAEDKFGPGEDVAESGDILDVTLVQNKPWYDKLLPLALMVVAVFIGALLIALAWWHLSLRGLNMAVRVYEEMCRLGRLLGMARLPYQTPVEYGESLRHVLDEGQEDVRSVVALYVKQQFSKGGLSEAERNELRERWRRLRWQMCHRVLKPRWRRRRSPASLWIPPSTLRPS